MKLYRDMTDLERAAADLEHRNLLHRSKVNAECEMDYWDSKTPEERAWERELDKAVFRAGNLDFLLELELEH